jgi:diaminopimelate epimerase
MTVTLRGGKLRLSVDPYGRIHMTGEAVEVFSGELSLNWRKGHSDN